LPILAASLSPEGGCNRWLSSVPLHSVSLPHHRTRREREYGSFLATGSIRPGAPQTRERTPAGRCTHQVRERDPAEGFAVLRSFPTGGFLRMRERSPAVRSVSQGLGAGARATGEPEDLPEGKTVESDRKVSFLHKGDARSEISATELPPRCQRYWELEMPNIDVWYHPLT